MIPNNNLSVLPWYTSIDQQNARKWWVYNKVYPLFTPAGYLLPFQLMREHRSSMLITSFVVYTDKGNRVTDLSATMKPAVTVVPFASFGYDVLVFPGAGQVISEMEDGRYYAVLSDGVDTWYSEVFTAVNDISGYVKIEWWDEKDFVMDAGAIVYEAPVFKNVLYLNTDIAKPEYIFEEEGETRDGYFFPEKQISEKRYKFSFLAPEYLLDVMRFIRMADYARITSDNRVWSLDTFLITPEWEDYGDIASVTAEFDTATVAKKIAGGVIKSARGDYNDDFNEDFDNRQ